MISQETVLCSAGASSSSQGLGAITLHDLQTGTLLASFKQTCADVHSTAVITTRNGEGGFILAAQPDKSVLNAYYFQKDQVALKMVLPERLSCIHVDNSGSFCAAGTSLGRIYLWEIASGILFNVWDAHYRRVSVLRFTQDGAALITGSEDSGVSVWLLSSLLDNGTQHDIPSPHCTLSDHTLPITDIACGFGHFPNCRVLTSSIDHSVKLWDLASQSLLTTFVFPGPIHCLAFENAERFFFAASSADEARPSSLIHEVKLYRRYEDRDGRRAVEAVGGAGQGEVIYHDAEQKSAIRVEQRIACLSLSMTQSTLLVGTGSSEVLLYDVASHQLVRSFAPLKDKGQGLGITYIRCLLKPPDLVGNISLGFNVSSMTSAKDIIPTRPVMPFQRVRDGKTRGLHEVSIMIPPSNEPRPNPTLYPMSEILKDQAHFITPQSFSDAVSTRNNSQADASRVQDLEAEVARLKSQLSKAKGINDAMWEAVVQRVIVSEDVAAISDVNGMS